MESWLDDVRTAAAGAAEKRFDEKAEEIFRNAQKMLEQIDDQQTRAQERLQEEIKRCNETNRRLEEQKTSIEQMVQQMQAQLALAESAVQQQRAAAVGSPALGAAAPPGLPGLSGWRLPLSPPMPGLGWVPPTDMPTAWPGSMPLPPMVLSETGAADAANAASGPSAAPGGGTGESGGDSEAMPPVISLLSLLGQSQQREWTVPLEELPPAAAGPLPPSLSAVTVTDLTAVTSAMSLSSMDEAPSFRRPIDETPSFKREDTPPRKAGLRMTRVDDDEDGIRTPPGLESPNVRSRAMQEEDADSIPAYLQSPKAKPRPVPEDCEEISTPGLRSPAPSTKGLQRESFVPTSPMRPAPTPQQRAAGTASSRSGTPAPRCPGTPDRNAHLLLTPKRTSRSAKGSSTPMKSPVPASPFVICEGGGCVFGFMLRLAEGVDLGIDIEHGDPPDQALHVIGIVPGGAIEAWNKQCNGGPGAGKVVMPGDKIVAVNGVSEAEKMLEECRSKQMLRLTVVRGDPECNIPAPWMPSNRRHTVPGAFGGLGGHSQMMAPGLKLMQPPHTGLGMEAPFFGSPLPPRPPSSPGLRAEASIFTPQALQTAQVAEAAAAAALA